MSYIGTKEFELEVRKGNVVGHTAVNFIGHTNALNNGLRALHPDHQDQDLAIQALYDTPATVRVASENTNDTSAGSGARTVTLYGQDSSGNDVSETITMAGQTQSSASSNTYRFIRKLEVATVGATGWNEGILWVGAAGTFTSGKPSTAYLSMEATTNLSACGSFCVPAGKTFYLERVEIDLSDSAKVMNVQMQTYDGTILREEYDFHTNNTNFEHIFRADSFAAGTLFIVNASVSVAGGIGTVITNGFYVDN